MKEITSEQKTQLSQPIPEWALKKHPTKTYLTVIHPMSVIERLNQVFGVGTWHFKTEFISCDEVDQKSRMAYMSAVRGILTIPDYNIHIEQYGGSTNDDKGDALKGGATDALTKCASYLGVGESIYKGLGNGGEEKKTTTNTNYSDDEPF